MAYWSRKWNCLVLLYFVLSTISVSSAIRIDDILYGRVKHIPLKRTQPGKFGFLRGADLDKFGNELAELHNDRAKRNVEDTVRQTNDSLITEFELKGDNHSVAFLHWAGKKSTVGCFREIFHIRRTVDILVGHVNYFAEVTYISVAHLPELGTCIKKGKRNFPPASSI